MVMTTRAPDSLLVALDALKARAAADPAIATSPSRTRRLGSVTTLLKNAAEDCTPTQLRNLTAYLHADTIGHPDQDDTVLGRAKTGRYRKDHPGRPLTAASQRHLMDGLADLNRAAGHAPYWWQQRGMRPWSKHTEDPIDRPGHLVLRRALCEPTTPRQEPFRLRTLLALEILWDTGVPPEGLVLTDTADLGPDLKTIRVTVNPPGRSATTVETVRLTANTRAVLREWLPLRRAIVAEHLSAGPDAYANQALFITLHHATGTYDDGRERMVLPGMRMSVRGLQGSCSQWIRRLNALHPHGAGWPVPTSLQQLGRGGANNRSSRR
jgi:hypothetical protein